MEAKHAEFEEKMAKTWAPAEARVNATTDGWTAQADDPDASGELLTSEVTVTVECIHDPELGDLPDPESIEARRETLPRTTTTVELTAGSERVIDDITIAPS